MRIPKSFQLQGHTIQVVFDNEDCEKRKFCRYADLNGNKIVLATKVFEDKFPKTKIEQTFIHEVIHHILEALGENKLNDNEKFVDGFAGHLHQILSTFNYESEN